MTSNRPDLDLEGHGGRCIPRFSYLFEGWAKRRGTSVSRNAGQYPNLISPFQCRPMQSTQTNVVQSMHSIPFNSIQTSAILPFSASGLDLGKFSQIETRSRSCEYALVWIELDGMDCIAMDWMGFDWLDCISLNWIEWTALKWIEWVWILTVVLGKKATAADVYPDSANYLKDERTGEVQVYQGTSVSIQT